MARKDAKTQKSQAARQPSPRDILLSYQDKWAYDEARFKIGLMARQTGKDFSSGHEGIRDVYEAELRGDKTTWLIAAPSERQSLESFEKWKEWQEVFKLSLADVIEEREGNGETLLKSATMVFPNGSRVIAVPGKPDTVRGFSANVLMTEFAFFEDPDATWRAILPSITNPLRGGEKKVRLISTANGMANKFAELWFKNHDQKNAKWSTHKVTIYDAVNQGLPVDPEELRLALDDPDGWAQEFLCEFIDTAAVLLGYDLIAQCENPLAFASASDEYWMANGGEVPLVLGIDFGRKRDLTVCWALECLAQNYGMTREVMEIAKTSTRRQLELLRPRIARARRVCFDYTGAGVGLGDLLVDEYGEWKPDDHKFGKIELCHFTDTFKREEFPKLRVSFDQKELGIPVSRVIREDLHSVHRITTAAGNVTYRAPHTKDGHADRCTALMLANRARREIGMGGGFKSTDGCRWAKREVFA